MASITGVFSNGSKNVIPWIDYTYTQNKDTVSTTITAKLYVKRATSYGQSYSSNCAVKLTIGGTVVVNKSPIKIDVRNLSVGSSVLVAEGSRTIKHDSNGNLSASIAGYVDMSNTSLGTANFSQTITFPTIIVNTPPTMSGSLSVSPSGTIAENTGTINVSWAKAGDAQGNANKYKLERWVNGTLNKTFDITNINTVSYSDTEIGSFGQGTRITYKIKAGDSFDTWSNTLTSSDVIKNTLTGATVASTTTNITSSFASIPFTWSGAKNTFTGTNATAFDYALTADGITIYNNTTTGTSMSVSIVDGTASGPYIKKADLINKFKSSNFNGSLTFTLKTANKFGSSKTTSKAISVDLRATPTAATPVISEDASLSTALKTVKSTGNKYFIPNGTDKIRITWSGGSDVLGQGLSYDVYIKIGNGGFEEKKTNLTVGYYDLVLPKQSVSQQIVARVITKTSYGYTKEKDSTARTLHYYNAPSVDVLEIDRTDETATATIKLKPNTSIPNINFPIRSYSGISSGTLSNTTNNQDIVATGLKGENTYSWTITFNDDTGFTSANQTKGINIPAYTPLFSVREKGVGVNCIPNGDAELMVNGMTKTKGVNIRGYQQRNTENNYVNQWVKIATLRVPSQYGNCGFTAMITGEGSGDGKPTNGRLVVKLKQQSAMGSAPYASLYLYDNIITNKDCFKMVITTNSATETIGEVWFKNIQSYESVYISPLREFGEVNFHESLPYQTGLPSGTQFSCSEGGGSALSAYPVGSIYMSVNNVNPSTIFGGTWVSWGAGRVPVGINTNDGDFNTVEKTGGAKSVSSSHTHSTANHTLTLSQIPAHNHSASSNSAGEHTHNIQNQKTKWGGGSGNYVVIDTTSGYTALSNKTTTSAGAHSHTITVNNSGGGGAHNHGNTGSASVSANVLQPYIVCYMWKRTA